MPPPLTSATSFEGAGGPGSSVVGGKGRVTASSDVGGGVRRLEVLWDHLVQAMQRTEQVGDELKAATATFNEGAPSVADRLTAAVDEHELPWALRRMALKGAPRLPLDHAPRLPPVKKLV